MAASVIAAVQDVITGLTISGTPTVWFDSAPLRTTGGAAVQPPYIIIHDDGMSTDDVFDFEYHPLETTSIRIEVYALSLTSIDAIVKTIKYGTGTVTGQGGLDFSSSINVSFGTVMETIRDSEQRFQEQSRSVDAGLVYRCRLTYRIFVNRTSVS